jgi:DNA-binding cell septation regulator SpoVG
MSLIYDSGGDPGIFPSRPTVTHYHQTTGTTALRAYVSILFPGGMKINNIRVFSRGQERWVSSPDHPYKRRNGETAYEPILEFSTSEAQDRFQSAVLDAVDRYLGKDTTNVQ